MTSAESLPPEATRRLLAGYADDACASLPLLCARLLADGDRDDLRWLFEHHDHDVIAAWLGAVGGRQLGRRSARFWSLVLDQPVDVPPPSPLWPSW